MAKKQKQPKQMKQKVKSKKVVKKSFYDVSAPITSTKIQLYAPNQESLINKTIKLDLTKSLRGKGLELILRIKLEKDKLVGIPESAKLENSYIRRVMRKGVDYVEDSFKTECRDSIVTIKPFLITRRRVSRAVLKALRELTKKNLEAYVKTRTSKELFEEIISNKLQKQLSLKLKKIYPLALCEIRSFKVESQKEAEESKKE